MPNAKPKRDPRATRQRILAAARRLLVQNDGALEMAWVAKEAGLSQGIAYHHFGSREGLIEAIVNQFYDKLDDEVTMAPLTHIAGWEDREVARTESYIRFMSNEPLGPVVLTRLNRTPAVAAVEAERWTRLTQEGARNIADGQRRGVVRSELDPDLLAALVLGAMRGAVTAAMQREAAIDSEALTQEIWGFVRLGLQLDEEGR